MNAPDALRVLLLETIRSEQFLKASFGGPRRGAVPSDWQRVSVRRLDSGLQFEFFDARKSFARNITSDSIEAAIAELIALAFSAIHLTTTNETIDIRLSKKGKLLVGRRPVPQVLAVGPHNRVKDVPLPEGVANPLLEAMGILGGDGRVKPSMRDKFAQINEFLKQFLHVLDDSGLRSLNRRVEILDAGCGSSYLTLALHHYCNERIGLPAILLGVDVNEEVIRKSMVRAERAGADTIRFVCDKIGAVTATPDVVIALHACDTATDAALAAAIRHEARLILCAPCCHHHLNAQLNAANAEVLRPILRHGILHERQADLITDAFRALILRLHGYRTEVVEFISAGHTARNLLLRAVKTAKAFEPGFVKEYAAMKAFFGVVPHLETLVPKW